MLCIGEKMSIDKYVLEFEDVKKVTLYYSGNVIVPYMGIEQFNYLGYISRYFHQSCNARDLFQQAKQFFDEQFDDWYRNKHLIISAREKYGDLVLPPMTKKV